MASAASKSLVRRPPPPPPHVDYRFDLSRKTVAGFATAGIAIAFLIFLSGLVLGVSIERPAAVPAAPAETKSPVARRGAVPHAAGRSRAPVGGFGAASWRQRGGAGHAL